ncbi:hypothetical protein HII36_20745 [Nonomuraea sp. NN258]|uniref:hypothetical protein n=1 Tax=Nonomuraea antri TaxID=2730852 RepID=UPI0015696474|nr:hypothetical protein [Nonomuraea antri]NRQ34262.1 hypothetical protein [Nonomuraea antri]
MKRLVLAWAVTAIAATGAGVAVLGLLGTGLSGTSQRVISQPEARAALASATATVTVTATPTPTATATATPTDGPSAEPSAAGRLLRSAGGTVVATCAGDLVTLRSWSPAQGYSVDGVEPGPATTAKVEFEPDEGDDVELRITCVSGRPVARRT